jgi:hypothetical protein
MSKKDDFFDITGESETPEPPRTAAKVDKVDFDVFGEAEEAPAPPAAEPALDFDIAGGAPLQALSDADMDAEDATRFTATSAAPPPKPVAPRAAPSAPPPSPPEPAASKMPWIAIGVAIAVVAAAVWWLFS